MVQESKAKVQQQVQQLQAKLGQQAAEIAKLQVHRSQVAQPSLVAGCQSGSGVAAGQVSTALKSHLHREKERPDVDVPKMASLIRYAPMLGK